MKCSDVPAVRIMEHGYKPPGHFVSDGCTCCPDLWRGWDLRPACIVHDFEYGEPGSERDRLEIDRRLRRNLKRCGLGWCMRGIIYRRVRLWGMRHFHYAKGQAPMFPLLTRLRILFTRYVTALLLICPVMAAVGAETPPQLPKAVILGPSIGTQGDLLILDASGSVGDHFQWLVVPELPGEKLTILPIEGGKKCLLCSQPGTYCVILVVSQSGPMDSIKWVVDVRRDDSPQPKPPGPGPAPPEPLPEGQFGLAQDAFDWAAGIATAHRRKATELAKSFRAIAAQIASGTLTEPSAIAAKTAESNKAILGERGQPAWDAWEPWARSLNQRLQALAEDGELRTADDHAVAWREIATGLEAVK